MRIELDHHSRTPNIHPGLWSYPGIAAAVNKFTEREEPEFRPGAVVPGHLTKELIREKCDRTANMREPPMRGDVVKATVLVTKNSQHSNPDSILEVLRP